VVYIEVATDTLSPLAALVLPLSTLRVRWTETNQTEEPLMNFTSVVVRGRCRKHCRKHFWTFLQALCQSW
jgi:hypothetical protein